MAITRSDFRVGNDALPIDYLRVDQDKIKWIAGRFISAWGRIPQPVRLLFEQYWRTKAIPRNCIRSGEPKEYHPHLLLHAEIGSPAVRYEGLVVSLPVPTLEHMGNDMADMAIAHELAHVSFYASGEPNHWARTENPLAYHAAEAMVHDRLLVWGMNQAALLAWFDNYERVHKLRRCALINYRIIS
ncbi:MAG: hypothetical protein ACYC3I_01720 [Gemmataceae bacterium]